MSDMASWSTPCPVQPTEQAWIDDSMDWLLTEFGRERLLGEVVLPTDGYFPGAYGGSREDVDRVLSRVCDHMGIDRSRIELVHDDSAEDGHGDLSAHVSMSSQSRGAAGHYRRHGNRCVVA